MHATDLRVALFSGNYNYVRDGANQTLNLLMGHALAYGAAVRVYSPTTATPAFAPVGDLVSVPSIAFPVGGRGEYRIALGLPKTTRADLAAFAPNVVHVSAPDFLGHAALAWARQRKLPTLASFHTRFETYFGYYGIGFIQPMVIRRMVRFYNGFDRVMTPGQSTADLLRGYGVTAPIGIWSRGVNHERFSPARRDMAWRRGLGIADDELAVGFLGRVVLEKGLDIFAEVMTALKARGGRVRALIVGEGPAQKWFADRVPDAVFAGYQTGDHLARAVASMDVFFNPSVTETFGNVTLEAMAAGVPVVAARATGTVDLVEDGVNGLLVPPRDVAAYAEAIGRYARDDMLRLAAGAAGRAKAATHRWDGINDAVMRAYQDILAARR